MSEPRHYQNIVIGSGAGGLVTALHLARAGHEVLILEEGAEKSAAKAFSLEEILRDYRAGGLLVTLGNAPVNFGEGRVVGGGTAVNSGYYFRPDFAKLEKLGKDWSVENLLETDLTDDFAALEQELRPEEIPGEAARLRPEVWADAAKQTHLKMESARFVHRWDSEQKKFNRRSCHDIWGAELSRRGVAVSREHRVRSLHRHGSGWELRGQDFSLKADHVFVCAGAVETPALLRRSGLTRNVGDNLRFHSFVRLTARFDWALNAGLCPIFPWKFSGEPFTMGHSPSLPHLMALVDPEKKESFIQDPVHWSSFYASFNGAAAAKVRNWGGANALIVFWRTAFDRARAGQAVEQLDLFLQRAGAREIVGHKSAAKFLQSVHLFGSCPMGEDLKICAADSYGNVHGTKNLHIHDASLLGSSPGTNPQASVMAIARRNTRHFLATSGASA